VLKHVQLETLTIYADHLIALIGYFHYDFSKRSQETHMVTAEQICQEANRLPRSALPTVLDFMLFLQKRIASLCVPDSYFFLGIPTGFSPPAQGCGCAATLGNA
jgi:hypothetical protein